MAYVERAHELMTSSTCAVTDRLPAVAAEATYDWGGANPEGLGDGQKLKAFRKYVQNLVKSDEGF